MLKQFACAALALSTLSCSSSYLIHVDAVGALFKEQEPLSLDVVKSSEVDLLSVLIDDRPFSNVALALIEQSKRKWMSNDGVLLIEENGRLVRTIGFSISLVHSFSPQKDPLINPQSISSLTKWRRRVDVDNGQYGLELFSTFRLEPGASIELFDNHLDVFVVFEDIHLGSEETLLFTDRGWTNIYWFHTVSGELVKSSQKFHPDGDNITSVYASRVARALNKVE